MARSPSLAVVGPKTARHGAHRGERVGEGDLGRWSDVQQRSGLGYDSGAFGRLVVGKVQHTAARRSVLQHRSDDRLGDIVSMDAAELVAGLDHPARAAGS
jgi:hypothetical protein